MEINHGHPLVSVAVITYNSAEYILETLESVKAQTYDNVELVVSDDCSQDNTIELCRQWIAENRSRFGAVHIVQSPVNTGQSGNYNRAFDACNGEWIKEIDGDDKLLPNCISDFIEYTENHPDAKFVFGKMDYIGNEKVVESVKKWFDYSFFSMTVEEQLHRLLYEGNCVPSPCSFYNREYIKAIGFRNDERIPYLEDHPKWISLIRKGVRFHLMDKVVAAYRVGNGISTGGKRSVAFYKTGLLFDYYYRFPAWCADDTEAAVNRMVNAQVELYERQLQLEEEIKRLRGTKAYRLGKTILKPFSFLKKIVQS